MVTQTELDRITNSNRKAWDESAGDHRNGPRWHRLAEGFKSSSFSTFDNTITELLISLPIADKSLVQIGCNNGQELLSAISLGARNGLGIDQSQGFLDQAEELNAIAKRECRFLNANIYSLPADTPDNHDLGLITIGVLNWMPDLAGFFSAVAGLLKPSSQLVIYETHPYLEMFEPTASDPHALAYSYFRYEPFVSEETIVYDNTTLREAPASYWFVHGLGDIINACISAGFRIDAVREYPHSNRETLYDRYENCPAQLPLCFSLIASLER